MEKEIIMLEEQFPTAAKGVAEFSTPLAHQIIAGTGAGLITARVHQCLIPCNLVSLAWMSTFMCMQWTWISC